MKPGMEPDGPMHRSGAEWCGEHGRWECAGNSKRSGVRCHAPAISGTARCRMHSGKKSEVVKAMGEVNLAAWSSEAANELPALNPGVVIMNQLRIAVMRADFYGEQQRRFVEDQQTKALVGKTYSAGVEGARVETGEQIRAFARLESEERDRVVKIAKLAHDMGIAEEEIRLEQNRARIVVAAFLTAIEQPSKDLMMEAFLGGLQRADEAVTA